MDTDRTNYGHYDMLDLDLTLHEPGEVEDTRLTDLAERRDIDDETDTGQLARLAQVVRDAEFKDCDAFVCVIAYQLPDGISTTAATVFKRRIEQDLQQNLRAPDAWISAGDHSIILGLCAPDCDAIRTRLALLTRLISIRMTSEDGETRLCSGFAPIREDNVVHGLNSARLAVELGSFNESGHIEFIDI